jgi:hypothetical protein
MSSWSCVVFETGDRDPEAVEERLRASIQAAEEYICRESEQEDPDTWVEDDRVLWYVHGLDSGTAFGVLDVDCQRALAIDIQDTSEAGTGRLFERVDGGFVQTDLHADNEFGRTVLDYFEIEHGIEGERRV